MQRRDFLKLGASSAGLFALSGLTAILPRAAQAAQVDIQLSAEAATKTLVDGTTVPVWRYASAAGGPGALGAGLVITAGDTLSVTLNNNLTLPVNVAVPGVQTQTPACAPGASRVYTFTLNVPGTYVFYDDANGELGRAMGLGGPLVVMPADGAQRLGTSGPSFDRHYTLVLQELDSRLNNAVAQGQPFDLADYAPDYFFVNGLSYPDTASDADTQVAMNLGEQVALRFVNAGLIMSPMHFHGYHVQVVNRGRRREQFVVDKDTVRVDSGQCVDVLLPVNQTGTYPLHTHYVPGVTANGAYGLGALVTMTAA